MYSLSLFLYGENLISADLKNLLEPFCMELIGTAWKWSHCGAFTRDRFQKVPRALLNHKYFQNKDVGVSFVFQNKEETSYDSIV